MSSDEAFEQAIVNKAGKIQGELQKLAFSQSDKADKAVAKLQRAYLTAAARAFVLGEIVTAIEDGTEEDIEDFADSIGLELEEFSKSNAKTLVQRMLNDAQETAEEFLGSEGLQNVLGLESREFVKLISKVRV